MCYNKTQLFQKVFGDRDKCIRHLMRLERLGSRAITLDIKDCDDSDETEFSVRVALKPSCLVL
jgi:hypothetical protein